MLLVLSAAPGRAQVSAPTWWLSAGGGTGWSLHRGDDGRAKSAAGVARVSLERTLGPDVRLGAEWLGSWMVGSIHGESRHHVGVVASVRRWEAPIVARLGLGLGTATVVEIDAPPPGPGPAGDVVVAVGDQGGLGGLLGAEVHVPFGARLRLVSSADVMIQRSAGHLFVTGLLTGRVLLGLGGA
ncbi:MAG TPA: hypothetical protein VE173_06370 [Longimicrobiales bacterium]|nr:hypothetical protein [Longimicrobiales bacterium]